MRRIIRKTILMQKGIDRRWWGPLRRKIRKARKNYQDTVVDKSLAKKDIWPL